MLFKNFVIRTVPIVMILTTLYSSLIKAEENPEKISMESIVNKIQRLEESIKSYQKREVWPGGNEHYGCYMWVHRQNFLKKGGAQQYVEEAKIDTVFIEGAKGLKYFSKNERFSFYEKWQKPVYPTWAMIHEVSSRGTTDAGYVTQKEIAEALVELVKDMFLYPENY